MIGEVCQLEFPVSRASSDLSRLPCVVSLEADAIMQVISNKYTWL